MIISCSRRTDIPAFYSEWMMNRLRSGTVCVVNPFNENQISRIPINSEVVDCIVFWTKNPFPLMQHLEELDGLGYNYYFQFTITPYQQDIEAGIKDKQKIIETFINLSRKIGKERVILRYDPIFLTEKYNANYHERAFNRLCEKLSDYTEKVIISFVDTYRKNKKNLTNSGIQELLSESIKDIAGRLKVLSEQYGLSMETCAESIDLSDLGIPHGKCIDGDLIEKIIGYKIISKDKRDANREHCGCMQCTDIGQYDTCLHKCSYCYANVNQKRVVNNYCNHNPLSELLVGEVDETKVNLRKDVKSFRVDNEQISLDIDH